MSKNRDITQASSQIRDLAFTELAIREKLVPQQVLLKAWTLINEMEAHDINRTLSSVLREREMIEPDVERQVFQHVGRIKVTCQRCKKALYLKDLDKDGRIRCERCETLLALAVGDEGEADQERPIEERITTRLVPGAAESAPRPGEGSRATAPGGAKAPFKESRSAPAVKEPSSTLESPLDLSDFEHTPRSAARASITKVEIDSVLHSGCYGRLYRGHAKSDSERKQPLAVKIFDRASLDFKPMARFHEALKCWSEAADGSPRTATSLFEEGTVYYSVRPFLDKPYVALADLRDSDVTDKQSIIRRVVAALSTIHASGQVHGNLKPSNVIVHPQAAEGRAYFVDPAQHILLPQISGLARWQVLSRSPRYRSPEEIQGKTPTAASDIYSLGWVLYAVLAGNAPFAGLPAPEILKRHQHGPCPELPGSHGAWAGLINVMTAHDPTERPKNAAETLQYVDAIIAGKSPRLAKVSPRTTPRQLEEFATPRRRRRQVLRFLLGPVALLAALGWVGFCFVKWHEASAIQHTEKRAERLYNQLSEEAFRRTQANATAQPKQGRALWNEYLDMFPDSPLKAHAGAEIRNFPEDVEIPRSE